ncbi:hypothetical protein D3C76_1048230 [compost metagenome]
MPHGEQRDVEAHVLESVQEEDDAEQEQEVVIARHHVLGAHVDERDQHDPRAFLDESLIAFRYGMCQCFRHADEQ